MTLESGYLLNKRYRIVEILGQGGMAAVYRAKDENLGVDVAVKENLFTTEEYARQFRREAVILANLRHPNLPRVTDHFVVEDQGQYLVMDYIEGEDLRQRMERVNILPDEEVIIIGAALCEALTYLHSRNPQVLHRDVKPGNVKITSDGQIFLVDFGLAKVIHNLQSEQSIIGGTPSFMSPEQTLGHPVDHRTDIYSLGICIFEMCLGTLPFSKGDLGYHHLHTAPPIPKEIDPAMPQVFNDVILRCMQKKPEERFQSVQEIVQAFSLA